MFINKTLSSNPGHKNKHTKRGAPNKGKIRQRCSAKPNRIDRGASLNITDKVPRDKNPKIGLNVK